MAEPLSTTASVMAVIGFAAESSKLMFRSFHGAASMPARVHEFSVALKALNVTLTNLRQTGTKLDPKYSFPAHFCSRLNECLDDLRSFEAKLKKIDVIFGKKNQKKYAWDGKPRRMRERIRWQLLGEQEMGRFWEKMKLYQSEFSLELLCLVTLVIPRDQ